MQQTVYLENEILKIVFFFKQKSNTEQCCQIWLLKLLLMVTLVSTIITGIGRAKLYISTGFTKVPRATDSPLALISRLPLRCSRQHC